MMFMNSNKETDKWLLFPLYFKNNIDQFYTYHKDSLKYKIKLLMCRWNLEQYRTFHLFTLSVPLPEIYLNL